MWKLWDFFVQSKISRGILSRNLLQLEYLELNLSKKEFVLIKRHLQSTSLSARVNYAHFET